MAGALITPRFLFDYTDPSAVSDYRSVVNSDGTAVIFERNLPNPGGGLGPSQLFILDLTQPGAAPTPFFGDDWPVGGASRPDWSWPTNKVAFNYGPSTAVGVVAAPGAEPDFFGAATAGMDYPTWFPDGTTLATECNPGSPSPNTTTISAADGGIIAKSLGGSNIWGGMPSVSPVNPNLIAFAGQAVSGSKYNQDLNYIYVLDLASGGPPVPLEAGAATQTGFDPDYQGRAPWWSPDGKWVVFESNRPSQNEADGLYAIYLYEYGVSTAAMQITSTIYNCNHAKWYPTGFPGGPAGAFQLTVAAWRNATASPPNGPYGLAVLDLTPLGIAF
jgi:hypothetical protein